LNTGNAIAPKGMNGKRNHKKGKKMPNMKMKTNGSTILIATNLIIGLMFNFNTYLILNKTLAIVK
jgi:hypothetical protein